MVDLGRVISTAIQFIDGFTRPSKAVIDNMKRMGNEAVRAGKQVQNAGRSISNAGSALTKSITLPVVGVATAALKTSNDFENAMAKVSTIAADGTPMENMKKQVVGLSNEVGVGVSDLAEAQYQAISAGVDTAASVDFVSTAVKAAKGGFTDTTTAVDGLTTVLNAYGMEAGQAAAISDQMLMAQNYGKTSFGDMASSMGKVIPIASSLNVSTEDLFSSIAVLTKNGINTSEAVTGLKAAYSNILKPSSDAAKTAKQLGLDFSSAHLQSVGWAGFLDEIKQKTGGNADTMAKLFGSTEALNSVTVLAGKGSANFAEALKLMGDAGGSTEKAYKKMLTPTERMNIAFNKIKNSTIQFGEALTPVFENVADIIGKVGDRFNNLSEKQVQSIVKFAGIAAAIGPVLMAFGKMVTAVGSVKRAWGNAMKLFASFKGIAGLVASPAGIVIGAVAGVALAAFLIIKNWDKVKGFLQGVKEWFQGAFEKAGVSVEGFRGKFESIGNSVRRIADKIGGFVKSIGDVFKKEFSGGIGSSAAVAGGFLESFAGKAASAFDGVVTAVDVGMQAFDALLGFFSGAFAGNWDGAAQGFRDSLKNIFPPSVADGMIGLFDNLLPGAKAAVEGVKSSFHGLIEDVKKIFGNVETVFGGFGSFFKGVFSGDAETALGGLKTAADGALDAVGNIFRTKVDAVKNFVVGAFSTFMPEGAVNKIAGAFDVVAGKWDMAINAAKGCVSGFVESIKPIIENVKTVFDGLGQFVKGVFTGDWKGALNGLKTAGKGALSGLLNVIKAPFKLIANTVKGAVGSFKKLNAVKGIFNGLGNAMKKVLGKCGVDMKKFTANINNIKARVSNIINTLKTAFGTVFGFIGGAVRKAATVVAGVFGKKISSTCSTAKAVILAFKAAAGAAFSFISGAIQKAMAVIAPVVKVAFNIVKNSIGAAVQNITNIISGVMTVFDGIVTFVSGVFTGNWKQAWEGVKNIFKGVFESLVALIKTPINAVIGIINGAISGINSLGLTIPDWVPVIGGKSFSLNIPPIPMLYKGTDNWQGGAAMIHDRGGEIVDLPKGTRVYPHDKSVEMARKEGAAKGAGQTVTVNIQKLAEKIEVRNDGDIDRIAEALALKLKKVAFNTGIA